MSTAIEKKLKKQSKNDTILSCIAYIVKEQKGYQFTKRKSSFPWAKLYKKFPM